MLNRERIQQKVSDIRTNLDFLRELASRADDAFLGDSMAVRAAKYAFVVITEAAANICSHVVAKRLHQAPETYGGCYTLLAEAKLLSGELAASLRRMAGFRNLLVHGYGRSMIGGCSPCCARTSPTSRRIWRASPRF